MKNYLKILAITLFSMNLYAQQAFTVDQALDYALENNINIKKAKIDQELAKQKVKETVGIGLPQLSAQGKYNYFLNIPVQLLPGEILGKPGTFVPVKFGQTHNASGGLTLTQLLFNSSYIVGLESSKTYRETMDLAKEKTDISIKEGIMLSYAAVLVTDENIKTLEENRKVIEKTLSDTRETYKVGLIEEQNVEQLEYSYKNLVSSINNLKRTKEKLSMTLKYLMGYPLDQNISLLTSFDEMLEKNKTLVAKEESIDFSNHIDIRLKNNMVKLNELKLKLQKSKALPTLAAAVSSSYNGYGNEFAFFKKEQQWFNTSVVALQLDIPIFSGLQRHWQTQQAKLDLQKTQLEKDDAEKNLKSDYFAKAVDYENSYDSYKTAQELINLSSNIYRKQNIKFKEGMGTSFDLQNSETQLFQSQTKYYQAAIELIQSKIKLDKAKGTL